MKYFYESAILGTPKDIPKGYIAGLKMSLYCVDPTSVRTASAHLMSYRSRQTSYEVRVTPILPIQKKEIRMLYKQFWGCLAPGSMAR